MTDVLTRADQLAHDYDVAVNMYILPPGEALVIIGSEKTPPQVSASGDCVSAALEKAIEEFEKALGGAPA